MDNGAAVLFFLFGNRLKNLPLWRPTADRYVLIFVLVILNKRRSFVPPRDSMSKRGPPNALVTAPYLKSGILNVADAMLRPFFFKADLFRFQRLDFHFVCGFAFCNYRLVALG